MKKLDKVSGGMSVNVNGPVEVNQLTVQDATDYANFLKNKEYVYVDNQHYRVVKKIL